MVGRIANSTVAKVARTGTDWFGAKKNCQFVGQWAHCGVKLCLVCVSGCNHICRLRLIFALRTSDYFMYHRCLTFKNFVSYTQSVFCVGARINSCHFRIQHLVIGFYNRDGLCLLRDTFYILRSSHTLYLCVLCGSENKQRLFHCTALTDWLVFITETECVYCAVRSTLYVLPTQCVYVFCVDLRTNSDCFTVQH
jgi:hypothetical protein